MRILISPAKQMTPDPDTLAPVSQPRFLPEARLLLETLRQKSDRELQSLWKTNDALTAENIQRVRTMDLTRNLTPALFCYHGIQYQYLGPSALEDAPLAWLSEHLRIGSGFYGLLRPLGWHCALPAGDAGPAPGGGQPGSLCLLGRSSGPGHWQRKPRPRP